MAHTYEQERGAILLRVRQFLPSVHYGLFAPCPTVVRPHKEGYTLRVDPRSAGGLRETQGFSHIGSGTHPTTDRSPVSYRSGRLGSRHWSGAFASVARRRQVAPGSLFVQEP